MPHLDALCLSIQSFLCVCLLLVQDINISLWRSPEEVSSDKSIFMNQGEWELLGVLPQFQEFSMETSNSYAEMKFYVSGRGCAWGSDRSKQTSTAREVLGGKLGRI